MQAWRSFPPPHCLLQRGQWHHSKCKRSNRNGIPQVCCSSPRCCHGSGRGEQPRLHGEQRCHLGIPWPSLCPEQLRRRGPLGSVVVDAALSARWKVACRLPSHLIKILRQVRSSRKHFYNSQRLGSSRLPLQIAIFLARVNITPLGEISQCPSTAQVGDGVETVPTSHPPLDTPLSLCR